MRGILAYLAILSSALAGFAHISLLAIAISAVVLTAITAFENASLLRRSFSMGGEAALHAAFTVFISLCNGVMASAAGYALGVVSWAAMGLN